MLQQILNLCREYIFTAEGARNPMNWPSACRFAIDYCIIELGERSQTTTVYFVERQQFTDWLNAQEELVRATGFKYTVDYTFFTWSFGPRESFSCQIN